MLGEGKGARMFFYCFLWLDSLLGCNGVGILRGGGGYGEGGVIVYFGVGGGEGGLVLKEYEV